VRKLGIERLYAAWRLAGRNADSTVGARSSRGDGARAADLRSSRLTPENIAFSSVARNAIMRDANFQDGDYYGTDRQPDSGLSVARMLAHITYVSGRRWRRNSGASAAIPRADLRRRLPDRVLPRSPGGQVPRSLRRQHVPVLSRVMDYFDPFADEAAVERLRNNPTRFLVVSFDTDWRFSTAHSLEIARVLEEAGCNSLREEIASPWGHDSFLLPVPAYHQLVRDFLAGKR